MKNKTTVQQWTNQELTDFIASHAPNVDMPKKRHLKFLLVKEILYLKNRLPIQIPHPERKGDKLTITLDDFMQGERV